MIGHRAAAQIARVANTQGRYRASGPDRTGNCSAISVAGRRVLRRHEVRENRLACRLRPLAGMPRPVRACTWRWS